VQALALPLGGLSCIRLRIDRVRSIRSSIAYCRAVHKVTNMDTHASRSVGVRL